MILFCFNGVVDLYLIELSALIFLVEYLERMRSGVKDFDDFEL